MNRLRRRIFNWAALISLFVFLAACALWMRSYWAYDVLNSPLPGKADIRIFVLTSHGSVGIGMAKFNLGGIYTSGRQNVLTFVQHRFAGFAWETTDLESDIFVPIWFVSMATAILPLLRIFRRHKVIEGMCRTCGYDLRASSDRCPECGSAIPSKAAI